MEGRHSAMVTRLVTRRQRHTRTFAFFALRTFFMNINFALLDTADIHAFEVRDKFIVITVFSLAVALVTGIPIVATVKDIPEVFYLVFAFIIFSLSMMILLLIVCPKYMCNGNNRSYL